MKQLRLLAGLVMAFLCLNQSYGQEKDIIITRYFNDVSLNLALINLKYEYNLEFEYEKELTKDIFLKDVNIRRMPLDLAMKMILKGSELAAIVEGKKVYIQPIGDVPVETYDYQPSAANFTVTGVVKSIKNGETLPHATVYVNGTKLGAMTNLDGRFTILNVPSDTSTLIVRFLGYRPKKFRLNPNMDTRGLVIGMSPSDYELDEVVISAQEINMIKSSGISQITLSPEQISMLPSLGEKDIFRSLQLLPGVNGTQEASSGLYVRGGTPDQNLILFDGFTVYHVDHFYGFFSAFNAEAVKDVQLFKGGFGAKYGGRMSSVVELTGKSGNTEEFDMGVGLSAISANARVETPLGKKGSLFIAGRRSYTDIIQSGLYDKIFDLFSEEPDVQGGGPGGGRFGAQAQTEPSFYFYDLNAKATFTPSDKDVLAISFYNGQDNLDNSRDINLNGGLGGGRINSFQNQTEDVTKWGNWGTSLKYARQWNDRLYSNAVLAYSNYYSQRDRFTLVQFAENDSTEQEIRNGQKEDNDVKDISLRIDNELLISQNNRLEFGAQFTYNDISYLYQLNDTLDVLNRTSQGSNYSAYAQDNWNLFDNKLSLSGGVRATYFDVSEKLYIEPRASISYSLTDKITLKGAWGIYHQFSNRIIREDVLQGSRDFWLLADDDQVPVGRAEHYIAGISYENKGLLVDVEAYHKNLTGLSEYTLRFTRARRQINYEELFFQGTGYARGIELLVQKKMGKFTGWIGYTLSEVRNQFDVFGEDYFPALHDQTHEYKIVGSYQTGRWTFAGTWIYATGKPYTAPIGGYQVTLLDGNEYDYLHISDKNAARLPAYHRLDLSATYQLTLGNSPTTVGVSIFNVYNRSNVWYKEFEIVENELIATDVTLLGATPNFFINFNLK